MGNTNKLNWIEVTVCGLVCEAGVRRACYAFDPEGQVSNRQVATP